MLHSVCQQIWKTQQWPEDWKRSVIIPIPKRGNAKECQITAQLHSFHRWAKSRSKILQAWFQQYVNWELPDVQAGFRKGRGTRDQIANICWIIEKARAFQRNIYFWFTDYTKVFVWTATKCVKFLKGGNTWPPYLPSWEICMQVKKQQLEPGM